MTKVFEIMQAGGLMMWPILGCSIVAMVIVLDRFWTLRYRRVMPEHLLAQVWQTLRGGSLSQDYVRDLRQRSPLGFILAAGLIHRHQSREVMKESIETSGRVVASDLERYLNTLGTIASVTPLLGLLGTVIGMVEVFGTISQFGVGNPQLMAGGISQALIATMAGLGVAIPSLFFFRFFRGRVNHLIVLMEQEAVRLMELLHQAHESAGQGA